MKPGDIVLVVLDPTRGSEQHGARPCVVVSPYSLNSALSICTVVPLTTKIKPWPTRVDTSFLDSKGQAAVEQIRTISQKRIKKLLGVLLQRELDEIRLVIKQTFVEE